MMTLETLFSNALFLVAVWYHTWITASDITDKIHLKKQVVSFLIARLNPESSRVTYCIIIRHIFSHVRPSWLLNSKLFTSALCCVTQFRRFLDTLRSSFQRQFSSSFIVSRAIHQERVVFLVSPFSKEPLVICCPTLWC